MAQKKLMDIQKLPLLALIATALKRLFADEAIPLAGNIAFRSIFSIFPFLIFLTSISGFFGSANLAKGVVEFLLSVAPEALVKPFSNEIYSILTIPRAGLLSVAALLTIWSAMGGVDSVRVGLNRAYDLTDKRPFWFLYAQNVVVVIGAAVLMLIVAVLLVILPAITHFFAAQAPGLFATLNTFDALRYPAAILLLMVGLTAAHQLLPAQRFSILNVLPGAGLTVLFWVLLTEGFGWYLRNFNSFASTYASLSGLFAAMFFIYLSALALIFGGEVNRVLILLRTNKPIPEKKPI